MKKLILMSALLFGFNGWSIPAYEPYDENADALDSLSKALKIAELENKYVLLQMGGNWCPDCRTLGEYFSRPDIKAWLDDRVILVSVDVGEWNRNLDIAEKYGNPISEGIPALVLLNSENEVMFATLAGELASARSMSKNDLIVWLQTKIDPMIN
ncbi:MAG: thiol reductase thioredoxin [Thiotrichales bacterium]|jgi:protein disulfide-isomerase|nr:thiol reductase thioredoxin [Thiotrichales bacterium]MDP6147215.1 thioredoxin family protein [Gammaproteobacteria bacterium]HJM09571.1 thioredoxin family protein [Gammaproteobacteria bacterium]HJN00454.1 thioredoxin family protein [Gammaproteobacteria bacterium]|tara:strand:- start:8292 stop:8756 length:465 start_codon:yes stop_codon:yes gene_type:complete